MRTTLMVVFGMLTGLVPAVAETPPLKPLPGSKACGYPADAHKLSVAGPVLFTAEIRPEGSVERVDIQQVPAKGLGFEEAVRDCVSQWHFEPIAGETKLRGYHGRIRYRIAESADEEAVRALLGAFASAWNGKNPDNIAGILGGAQGKDTVAAGSPSSAVERFKQERAAADWNMELEPDFDQIRLLRPGLAVVTQSFHQEPAAGASPPMGRTSGVLEATAVKRGDWWTLLGWYPIAGPPSARQWVVPGIEMPQKVKYFSPVSQSSDALSLAARSRVTTVVTLRAEVDASGHVRAIRILRGHPLFDDAAMEAVKRWQYSPVVLAGTPIPFALNVKMDFSFRQSPFGYDVKTDERVDLGVASEPSSSHR